MPVSGRPQPPGVSSQKSAGSARRFGVVARSNSGMNRSHRLPTPERQTDQASAERRHVQNDHNERKKVHAHDDSDREMHPKHAGEPDQTRPFRPDEEKIPDFQHTNENSGRWEKVSPEDQDIRRDDIKRWSGQGAPNAGAIPPAGAKNLGEPAKEIDEAKM